MTIVRHRVLVATLLALLAAAGCPQEGAPPAPLPVEVEAPQSPTNQRTIVVRGQKPASTAVVINNQRVVSLSVEQTFAVDVELVEGANRLVIEAEDGSGKRSQPVVVTVTRDTVAPAAPVVSPAVPPRTLRESLSLRGSKPTDATLFLNGQRRVGTVGIDTFDEPVTLVAGDNQFRLSLMDAAQNESTVVVVNIARVNPPFFVDWPPDGSLVIESPLTLRGTHGEGVVIRLEGGTDVTIAPPAAPASDTTPFAIDLPLLSGLNTWTVSAFFEGDDDLVVSGAAGSLLLNAAPLSPPTILVSPARASQIARVEGTKPFGAGIVRDGTLVVPTSGTSDWADDVPLAGEGPITLLYQTTSVDGVTSDAVAVTIVHDSVAPVLTVTSPASGDALGNTMAVVGTVQDADPLVGVNACVGTCTDPAQTFGVVVANGAFADNVQTTSPESQYDGLLSQVVVRAIDGSRLVSSQIVPVVLARAPASTAMVGRRIAIASGGTPYELVMASANATEVRAATLAQQHLSATASMSHAVSARTQQLSDVGSVAIGDVRAAWLDTSAVVAFAESSARAGDPLVEGRGVVIARADGDGFVQEIVPVDVGSDVLALDVMLRASGTVGAPDVVLALVRHDAQDPIGVDTVELWTTDGGTWNAPVVVSDGVTTSVSAVAVALSSAGAATVAWIEASARDGTLDDTDVVLRLVDVDNVVQGAPVLVTADNASFVDAAQTTFALTVDHTDTAVLLHDNVVVPAVAQQEAWLATVDATTAQIDTRVFLQADGPVTSLAIGADHDRATILCSVAMGDETWWTSGPVDALPPLMPVSGFSVAVAATRRHLGVWVPDQELRVWPTPELP